MISKVISVGAKLLKDNTGPLQATAYRCEPEIRIGSESVEQCSIVKAKPAKKIVITFFIADLQA